MATMLTGVLIAKMARRIEKSMTTENEKELEKLMTTEGGKNGGQIDNGGRWEE
jgi:hypothetical protein